MELNMHRNEQMCEHNPGIYYIGVTLYRVFWYGSVCWYGLLLCIGQYAPNHLRVI